MQKREPTSIGSSLNIVSSHDLSKSIAKDLSTPDPTGIIAKEVKNVNENSKKYDRGAGSVYHIEDLFETGK